MGITGGGDVPNCIHYGVGIAVVSGGELRGMSPNVQLNFELWGHDNHEDVDCECQASDRTAAYVRLTDGDRLIRLIRKWLRTYVLSLIGKKAARD